MHFARTLCLLLVCFSLRLAAQEANDVIYTERLSARDGLSHRWTMCVHQDVKGYLWIGTYDGLNRYDGNDFTVFRPSASANLPVSADIIIQIVETQNGKFQVNTRYGILSFDPDTGDFDLLVKRENTSAAIVLNSGRGSSLMETGVEYVDGRSVPITIYETLPSGKLAPLSKIPPSSAKNYRPILGSKEVIWFWDGKGSYHRFKLKEKTWDVLPITDGRKVPMDRLGNLWLPMGMKLRSFHLPADLQNVQWTQFSLEQVNVVSLLADGDLNSVRMLRYELGKGSIKTILPSENPEGLIGYVVAQWVDEEGTLWLTGFQGLTKVRYTSKLFEHYLSVPVKRVESPPSGKSIRQIAEDSRGNIFLRGAGNDFYRINPVSGITERIIPSTVSAAASQKSRQAQFGPLQHVGSKPVNWVTSVTSDPDGSIWFSSLSGLFCYDPETELFRKFPLSVSQEVVLFADDQKRIWWLSQEKSYLVDKQTGALRQLKGLRRENFDYGVMLPKQQTLWGFTDTGLIKVNTQSLETRRIRLYDEPREQRCLVAHKGWLWIGTSRGLEKVDPKTFTHINFDRSKGLPGNFVYSMVADGNYLWLGTSDGLCRFDVETGAVKNFYAEDGLSHNEFNSLSTLKSRNGRIYMGGLNGVNAFSPSDLVAKTAFKSRILLSGYSSLDKGKDSLFTSYTRPEKIELSPSATSLSLHLALSSYLAPTKNQYAWRMDGLDNDWFYAGNQHIATYRYLAPGSYTFRAKAADPFGNWSENELSIQIIVLGPWYGRWWAWLVYLLLTGGAAFLLYRFQLNKRLEHAERIRLQELDAFKSRFFTNITHEFRTPLTVILGMAEQVEPKVNDEVKSKIGLIRRSGENLLRLINQILDLAKLESDVLAINYVQDDLLPYLRYITESLQSLANAQNVLLLVESPEGEITMDFDPDRILQIVHNLLSNAIKFTPSGGKVTLRVELVQAKKSSGLKLSVTDNGAGIPEQDLPHIFDRFYQGFNLEKAKAGGTGIGLALTKELVRAMNGEIDVESEVNKKTVFTVLLPITNKGEKQKISIRENQPSIITERNTKEALPAADTESLDDSSPKLLIIEDNPDVVEYLVDCLSEHYHLDFAYNGRAGIEKALELVPDMIISDVMMPEKDGFEVCETLKKDERTSHIPIILLTARADAASRIAGLRRGADAYLSKPFHREELLANLDMLKGKQRRMVEWFARKTPDTNVQLPPEADGYDDIQLESVFIQKVRSIVAENFSDENFGLTQLCDEIGMSRSQLFRKMSALVGTSPSVYIRSYRLQEAKRLLETTELNVSEVAWQCGFVNLGHFSKVYQEEFGVTPSGIVKN